MYICNTSLGIFSNDDFHFAARFIVSVACNHNQKAHHRAIMNKWLASSGGSDEAGQTRCQEADCKAAAGESGINTGRQQTLSDARAVCFPGRERAGRLGKSERLIGRQNNAKFIIRGASILMPAACLTTCFILNFRYITMPGMCQAPQTREEHNEIFTSL